VRERAAKALKHWLEVFAGWIIRRFEPDDRRFGARSGPPLAESEARRSTPPSRRRKVVGEAPFSIAITALWAATCAPDSRRFTAQDNSLRQNTAVGQLEMPPAYGRHGCHAIAA
jgi:hypothetical protein